MHEGRHGVKRGVTASEIPGRNQLCRCGSGRKYKRCCYPADAAASAQVSNAGAITFQVRSGLPGQYSFVRLEPIFPETDPRHGLAPKGPFDVTYTLAKPGHAPPEERGIVPADKLEGDSHLAITRPAIDHDAEFYRFDAVVNGQALTAQGIPNAKGFLGKIVVKGVAASDGYAAEALTHRLVFPALSNISSKADIPLFIWQADIVDVPTGNYYIRFANPHHSARYGNVESWFDPEVASILSIYREAMNSNTAVYQFLCFYKIVERLLWRRGELSKQAAAEGRSPNHPKIKVPKQRSELKAWLETIYPQGLAWTDEMIVEAVRSECLGRSVTDIRDADLQPIRDNISHALFENGTIGHSIDDPDSMTKINQWLPTVKTLARAIMNVDIPVKSNPVAGVTKTLGIP